MKMDTLRFAAIVLAAALPVLAADTSPDSAFQVTSTDLQVVSTPARRAEAYIVVRNVSSRTITQFSYSVLARYADGSEQTTRGKVDLLNSLMLDELRPLSGIAQSPGSLERLGLGDSWKITALFPVSGEGLAPVSVTMRIVMVAFDDNTALGDLTQIRSLQAERMEFVRMLSAIVSDLRRVKNSPSPNTTVDELILSLSGKDSSEGLAPGRILILRLVSERLAKAGAQQFLDKSLALYEAQLAFVTKYSNLGVPPTTEGGARTATRTATTPVVESIKVSTIPEPLQSIVRAKMAPFLGRQISGDLIREMLKAAQQVDSHLGLFGIGEVGEFEVGFEESSSSVPDSSPQANFPSTPGVQRIKVSGGVQQSKLIDHPKASYPQQARDARISGTVRFDVLIGTDGHVASVQLVSGHPLLVPAAQEMVTQSVYRPTLLNGQPVEVQTQVEMNFTLQ